MPEYSAVLHFLLLSALLQSCCGRDWTEAPFEEGRMAFMCEFPCPCTKAVETAAEDIVKYGFKVSARIPGKTDNIVTGQTTKYVDGKFVLDGYYWPVFDTVDVYAVYPPEYDLDYGSDGFQIPVGQLDGGTDLMIASSFGNTAASCHAVVGLTFRHTLSCIGAVNARLSCLAGDFKIRITGMSVLAPTSGVLGYDTGGSSEYLWTDVSGEKTYLLDCTGTSVQSTDPVNVPLTGMTFIPADDYQVTVTFDLMQGETVYQTHKQSNFRVGIRSGEMMTLNLTYNVVSGEIEAATLLKAWENDSVTTFVL